MQENLEERNQSKATNKQIGYYVLHQLTIHLFIVTISLILIVNQANV